MKKMLNTAHRWIVYHATYGSVFYIPFIGTSAWLLKHQGKDISESTGIAGFLNGLAFIWILCLAYTIAGLVLYKDFREAAITRLAGFRERDEREQLVTANASRNTFLLTLAFEIVLLIMSMTTVHIYKDNKSGPGPHGVITVGMGFTTDIYSQNPDVIEPKLSAGYTNSPKNVIWDIGGNLLPKNMTMILLLLILIQLGSFRILSQRDYKGVN